MMNGRVSGGFYDQIRAWMVPYEENEVSDRRLLVCGKWPMTRISNNMLGILPYIGSGIKSIRIPDF